MIHVADISKSIRLAVDTGDVRFGSREAVKAALNGEAKLIVVARNCPPAVKNDIGYYSALSSVHTVDFAGTSIELGSACGKPFPVSALTVFGAGSSDLMELAKPGAQ